MEGKIRPTKLINNVAYYTFEQAMLLLGFSKRTLQRKMKRREIQFLKLGRETFFHPDAIDEYLEKQTVKAKISMKLKGGHRHNQWKNAMARMRKCHICGDPIVRGCEVISDWTNAEFMCRECCRNDAKDYCSAVGINFSGVTFQTRR